MIPQLGTIDEFWWIKLKLIPGRIGEEGQRIVTLFLDIASVSTFGSPMRQHRLPLFLPGANIFRMWFFTAKLNAIHPIYLAAWLTSTEEISRPRRGGGLGVLCGRGCEAAAVVALETRCEADQMLHWGRCFICAAALSPDDLVICCSHRRRLKCRSRFCFCLDDPR
jgi:hypothetical protein